MYVCVRVCSWLKQVNDLRRPVNLSMHIWVCVCVCKCIGYWLIIQHWTWEPQPMGKRAAECVRELTALWVNSSCWQGCHLFYSLIHFNFQRKLRHSNNNSKKTETISIAFTFSLRLIKMRHKFQLKYATAAQQQQWRRRQRDVALQLRAAADVAAGRCAELGLWKLLHVKWSMEQMSVA